MAHRRTGRWAGGGIAGSRLVRVAGLLALGLAWTAPARGQTLRGRILDSESGDPVPLAYVGLLAEGQRMVVAALAGTTGDFSLDAPLAGSYFVYVARTGYETLMDGVFELGEDGIFDVRIGLKPEPIPLEPLVVEADRNVSPLERVGFYERAVTGRGTFLVREQIERRTVERITDAFQGIPSIGVQESRPLAGTPNVMRYPEIVVRRGDGQCRPTLYVDRAVMASGAVGPVRPDDFVSPGDVEAIEIYARDSEVPVEFDAINHCGVVLIWTRLR